MTRGFSERLLSKTAGSLFGFFSRCEDKGVLPRVAQWLKLSLLGFAVALIAACGRKPAIEPVITCYEPVAIYPRITELEVKPNPTAGAEEVTVMAKVEMVNSDVRKDTIASGMCIFEGDTVEMAASDGKFDESEEELVARIRVADTKKDSAEVRVEAFSNHNGWSQAAATLRISK